MSEKDARTTEDEEESEEHESKSKTRRKGPCIREGPDPDTFIEVECESLSSSCTETSTSTGNLIDRMIHDPTNQREPYLKQWPVLYPKTDEIHEVNPHQYRASIKATAMNQMCFLRVDSSPNSFRQPAIVATLGPSCSTVDTVLQLLEAGMNVARINMAHIDPCSRSSYFQNVIEATNRYSASVDVTVPITIMMDLKGPEIRSGRIDETFRKWNGVTLKKRTTVRITSDPEFAARCTDSFIYVDCEVFPIHVMPGMQVFLADGDIELIVDSIVGLTVICTVVSGGVLHDRQQVHIPMLPLPLPPITDCDLESLDLAVKHGVDIVVVPKTRNGTVIYSVKAALGRREPTPDILVFAKISHYEGIKNIDSIIAAADGIVIHRRDLLLELPRSKLFIAEKEIIAKCNKAGKPVIGCVRITSDIIPQYIMDGADALVLTTETATGNNGPADIKRLDEIIREAEAATMQNPRFTDLANMLSPSLEPVTAITLSAVEVANKIRAAAILAITTSGRTAQLLSWFRPRCPVIAISRVARVARQLNLWRSVIPLVYAAPLETDWFEDCSARIRYGIGLGREKEIIRPGDPLVLVTGYRKDAGFTNCLRVVFASVEQGRFVDNAKKFFAKAK